jgi:hypothetical protein
MVRTVDHLVTVGGITDEDILVAAMLQGVIQNKKATAEEIEEQFGATVASIVSECTYALSLASPATMSSLAAVTASKSDAAKLAMLAEVTMMLESSIAYPPFSWRRGEFFNFFNWAGELFAATAGINKPLDHYANEVFVAGRKLFADCYRSTRTGVLTVEHVAFNAEPAAASS